MTDDDDKNGTPVTLYSDGKVEKPLDLPRFVFICGGDTELKEKCTQEIIKNSLNHVPESVLMPIVSCTFTLFFNSNPLGAPEDFDELKKLHLKKFKEAKGQSVSTFGGFMEDFIGYLKSCYGSTVLGKILLNGIDEEVPYSYVIFDTHSPWDIVPVAQKYGDEEVLVCIRNANDAPRWRNGRQYKVVSYDSVESLMEELRNLPARKTVWSEDETLGAA